MEDRLRVVEFVFLARIRYEVQPEKRERILLSV